MRRCRLIAGLALLLVLAGGPSWAWGVAGHKLIVQNAVELLPDGPLKAYMGSQVAKLRYQSVTPDMAWKDDEMGVFERPNHYIDLEYLVPDPAAADLPRTRIEAMERYTQMGLPASSGGLLPWRLEEMYWELANALATGSEEASMIAAVLSHYAADATQPLHTTVDYDGRADQRVDGRKALQGIHRAYESDYLEAPGLEFQQSSLAMAEPAGTIDDIHAEIIEVLLAGHAQVDPLYEAVAAQRSSASYADWDRVIGPMTRRQLATAAELTASLWLTAWGAAGRPELR